MIKVVNLTVSTLGHDSLILKSLSYSFKPGRITALVGPSGAGKTSLLSCIAQQRPYQGKIFYNNTLVQSLSPAQRGCAIGLVFQQYNLFNNLTVIENCTLALTVIKGYTPEKARTIAHSWLQQLEIEQLAARYPHQLSGGQQQRVALARALSMDPEVLLLDEPTAALDPYTAALLLTILQKKRAEGLTIILSSHDMNFVQEISEEIIYLEQGALIQQWNRSQPLEQGSYIEKILKQ